MQRLHTSCDKAWKFEEPPTIYMHTVIIDKNVSRPYFKDAHKWTKGRIPISIGPSEINPRAHAKSAGEIDHFWWETAETHTGIKLSPRVFTLIAEI